MSNHFVTGPSYGIQGSDVAGRLALERAYQSVMPEECHTSVLRGTSLCPITVSGPSYGIQGSDVAGGLALERAYQSVMSEECQTAIVGGTSLCLKKMQNMTFINKNMLSTSGLCQPFDEDGKQRQI